MAVTQVINISHLTGAKRVDPEFYQPDYLQARNKVLRLPTKTIGQISSRVVSFGAYSLCNHIVWRESGIPYLKAENILDGYIDYSEAMFIDEDVHRILAKSEVNEGQVLFSMSGTTGNAAVAYKIPAKLNASQDVAKITLRQGYSPFYVAAFLNSRYGRLQTQREIVGSVQQHVFLWQIRNFVVPIVPRDLETRIETLQREGLNQCSASNALYSQAENLLLEELGLKDFKRKNEVSYTVNLSNAFGVHRVDAEYFQPVYEILLKRIRKFEFNELGRIAKRVAVRLKPNPEEAYKYIEVSDIDVGIGETNCTERLGKELPPNARIPINGDELIISKVRPTRGAISIVPKELNASVICSSAFSVFQAESPLKEYVYMVSRSLVGRVQMERPTTGTSYPTIDDKDIENIEIPLLPSETQQRIASLVRQSHEARRKAKQSLEEAKKEVENLIEGWA